MQFCDFVYLKQLQELYFLLEILTCNKMRYNPVEGSSEVKGVFIEYSWVFLFFLGGGCPIWRNTEIGLFSQRNSEKLYIFWRTFENRNIVGHGHFVF